MQKLKKGSNLLLFSKNQKVERDFADRLTIFCKHQDSRRFFGYSRFIAYPLGDFNVSIEKFSVLDYQSYIKGT